MVQTTNRLFDEIARLMNDATGVAQGVRREVETVFRTQAERILRDLDVVTARGIRGRQGDGAAGARGKRGAQGADCGARSRSEGGNAWRPAADGSERHYVCCFSR